MLSLALPVFSIPVLWFAKHLPHLFALKFLHSPQHHFVPCSFFSQAFFIIFPFFSFLRYPNSWTHWDDTDPLADFLVQFPTIFALCSNVDSNFVQNLHENAFQKKSLTSSYGLAYSHSYKNGWHTILSIIGMTSSSDVLSAPTYRSTCSHPTNWNIWKHGCLLGKKTIRQTAESSIALSKACKNLIQSPMGCIQLFSDKFDISSGAASLVLYWFIMTCLTFTEDRQRCLTSSGWTIVAFPLPKFDVDEERTVMDGSPDFRKKLRSSRSSG